MRILFLSIALMGMSGCSNSRTKEADALEAGENVDA